MPMAEQRVALVTGANTGIGWAIAKRLQRDGFALGFHTHRDDTESRRQFEEIEGNGPAHWVHGDVSDPAVPERIVRETREALGPRLPASASSSISSHAPRGSVGRPAALRRSSIAVTETPTSPSARVRV